MLKNTRFRIVLLFSFFTLFVLLGSSIHAMEFSSIKKEVKEHLKNFKDDFKLLALGFSAGSPASLVTLSKTEYYESSQRDLIVLTGTCKLPAAFEKLEGSSAEVIITIAPDAANSKKKDLMLSITTFFEKPVLGEYYKKFEKNFFQDLLSGHSFITHSTKTQNIAANDLPEAIRKKFQTVLGKDFLLQLQDGVVLFSEINLKPQKKELKDFARACEWLKIDRIGVRTSLFLSPDWRHITLKLILGDGMKLDFLPEQVKATTPFVYINLSELGVGFEMDMKMNDKGQILKGIGQMSFPILLGSSKNKQPQAAQAPTATGNPMNDALMQAAFATSKTALSEVKIPFKNSVFKMLGALRGIWENAFNFKNLKLYDLVLKMELPIYANGVTFGFGGRFDVGKIKVDLGALIPVGYSPWNVAYKGKVNEIPLGETFSWLLDLNPTTKKKKAGIPLESFCLKDVIVSVAAQDDRDLNIQAGIKYAGSLYWDKQDLGHVDIRTTHGDQEGVMVPVIGFRAEGWIKKINLGPLTLSGKGPDGEYGKKDGKVDDGPYLDMAYGTFIDDHLRYGAIISIFEDVQVEADFSVGYGFDFSNWRQPMKNKTNLYISSIFREKVGELGEGMYSLVGNASLVKPELKIKIAMTENFIDELLLFSTKTLDEGVTALMNEVAEAREEVESLKPDLSAAKAEVAKGLDGFTEEVKKLEEKIKNQKKKVDSYEDSLKKRKKQLKDLPWNKFKRRAFLIGRIAKLEARIVAAEAAYTAMKSLKASGNTEKVAKELQKMAENTLAEVEKQMENAQNRLSEAMKDIENTKEFSKNIKNFGKNFVIDEVGYEADFGKIFKGKIPFFYLTGKLYNKKIDIKTEIDIKNAGKTMFNLLKKSIDEFAKEDKKIGIPAQTLLNAN